jgi:hypothetical protein
MTRRLSRGMAEDGTVLEIEIGEIAEYEYVSNLEPGFVSIPN